MDLLSSNQKTRTMHNLTIRPGSLDDFAVLSTFEWSWLINERTEPVRRINAGLQEFYVAELDGELVGELHIEWMTTDIDHANGISRAYLSTFRVEPERRQRGIGTALMNACIARVREQGFPEVSIGAYEEDVTMQAVYRRWGFTELVRRANDMSSGTPVPYLLLLMRFDSVPG